MKASNSSNVEVRAAVRLKASTPDMTGGLSSVFDQVIDALHLKSSNPRKSGVFEGVPAMFTLIEAPVPVVETALHKYFDKEVSDKTSKYRVVSGEAYLEFKDEGGGNMRDYFSFLLEAIGPTTRVICCLRHRIRPKFSQL